MARRTLLIIIPSLQDTSSDIVRSKTEIFQRFYKVCIDQIPDPIYQGIFSSVLYDPTPKNLLESLHSDILVFIVSIQDKIGYIGVSRDVFSREWSIELPTTLSWDQVVECAKQTPQSLISFS